MMKKIILSAFVLGAMFSFSASVVQAQSASLTQNMRQRGQNLPAQVVLLQRTLLALDAKGELDFLNADNPIYASQARVNSDRGTLREAVTAGNGLFAGITVKWLKAFQQNNLDRIRNVPLTYLEAQGKTCEGQFGALDDGEIATGVLGNCTRDLLNTLIPSLNLGGSQAQNSTGAEGGTDTIADSSVESGITVTSPSQRAVIKRGIWTDITWQDAGAPAGQLYNVYVSSSFTHRPSNAIVARGVRGPNFSWQAGSDVTGGNINTSFINSNIGAQ